MSQYNWNLLVIKKPFCAIVKDVKEKGSYFYCYAQVSAYLLINLKIMVFQFNPKMSMYIVRRNPSCLFFMAFSQTK